ncbi:hypothetical protein [Dyadobacter bucti]|uniref:hypothetical protein n=1 Tax=Dyadobacter bucti TaxID=2572203 RepID=UPI0014075E16|nr:hypothetical protein [Dyadobacter bucti]
MGKKGENGLSLTDVPICEVEEHPMIKTCSEKERGILEAHIRGVDALEVDEMSGARRLVFAQQRRLYAIPLLGLQLMDKHERILIFPTVNFRFCVG